MPPSEPSRIFISYAHKDGAGLAKCLQRDLEKQGLDAWIDKERLKGGASWTRDIETALDNADYVLALLTPGSFVSEICRAEQLRALREGKCVIPLKAHRNTDIIPLHLETKSYHDFTEDATYTEALAGLINDIHDRRGITLDDTRRAIRDQKTGDIRRATEDEIRYDQDRTSADKRTFEEKFRTKFRETNYVTVPPLPVNFVDRPEALSALRSALLTDGCGRHLALTALQGMGGIGKTVLAQALCHDEVVQQAFPDGIVWVTLGNESTMDLTRMREVGKSLGDDLSHYDNMLGAKNQYRSAIRSKATLIVVDDVWDAKDLDPVRAESSPRSRLLFTTRDKSIAAAMGAHEHIADLLTYEQSRDVLALWSRTEMAELPPLADDLIRECGRLPLALSMVGAMLRGKPPAMWRRVYDYLCNADLAKIAAHFPDYPYRNLLVALQVSVNALLDPATRERYVALSVLLEDMPISPAIQQCLWKVDEFEAAQTAAYFVDLSLAQRDQPEGSIRLHDLQLDYVRAQCPDKDALPLIHEAVRLSLEVLTNNPADASQCASQIFGRLLCFQAQPGVKQFLDRLFESAPYPWLRPLTPSLKAPSGEFIRALVGHPKTVNTVAVCGDGRLAISASSDRTLKVWEVESGRELRTLEGHSDCVCGAAFSGDGRIAVSASSDDKLMVWDVKGGSRLSTLRGHSSSVNSVAVSIDGQRAISASSDRTLKVWEVESGRELRTLEGHTLGVNGVAMSGDGRLAVSASRDNTLKVWEVETGRELRTLQGHFSSVTGVAMSGDGRLAVSASADKTLKVWEVDSGRELRTLQGSDRFWAVAFGRDGRLAVSASADRTLNVWEINKGVLLATFTCDDAVRCCAFVDARTIIAGDSIGSIHFLRLEEPEPNE